MFGGFQPGAFQKAFQQVVQAGRSLWNRLTVRPQEPLTKQAEQERRWSQSIGQLWRDAEKPSVPDDLVVIIDDGTRSAVKASIESEVKARAKAALVARRPAVERQPEPDPGLAIALAVAMLEME